jgi:REP element-mobilizing transposase RayT
LRRGRVSIPNQIYNITVTTLDRQAFFHDFHPACAAARCFHDFHPACAAARCFHDSAVLGDATLLAWVLMPDHAHWLLQLGERDELTAVVNRLKSAAARTTNLALGRSGKFWSPAFHDHALRRDEDIQTVARYIIANPLRAGLVTRVGTYPFWNTVWLE